MIERSQVQVLAKLVILPKVHVAKHSCILCMWLNKSDTVNGVHRTCIETMAVSCGTSHVTATQHCNHIGGYSKDAVFKLQPFIQSHMIHHSGSAWKQRIVL